MKPIIKAYVMYIVSNALRKYKFIKVVLELLLSLKQLRQIYTAMSYQRAMRITK